jgi:hypothetical protein
MNSRSNCGPRRHPAIGSPLPCADSDRSESLYSLTLLISFLLGGIALVASLLARMRPALGPRMVRVARLMSGAAWIAVLVSVAVHLWWGHAPGGPSALGPAGFLREHFSFIIACGPVQNPGWGLVTQVTLPGGGTLGVYQPRHGGQVPRSLKPRGRE